MMENVSKLLLCKVKQDIDSISCKGNSDTRDRGLMKCNKDSAGLLTFIKMLIR